MTIDTDHPASPSGLPYRRARLASPSTAPLDRLQLTVMRRIDGLLAGDHAGLLPGHGTERGEARPYVPGDDPRHIDWAVTARTNDPHVRDTISDHELELWIVFDASASTAFGTGRSTKHELGWCAAGAFALLAGRGGNRVGAVRSSSSHGHFTPARSGRNHVAALLAGLRPEPEDGDDADLGQALERLRRTAHGRGMVVVVSDFHGEPTWERPLRAVAARHEVIAVQVADLREFELPDVGLIAVVDPETGRRRMVDTADATMRDRYARLAARRQDALTTRLGQVGADHLLLRTDRDWVFDLVRFVSSRRTRRAAARPRNAAPTRT
ncbi:MAG: hypothetical protein RL238_3639 [Actinomycetota bacterium]|jgi:uncharacterized protein (DUF58 family)